MDDPMIRSRLGRINGTRPLGALDPKREPLFFCCVEFLPICRPTEASQRCAWLACSAAYLPRKLLRESVQTKVVHICVLPLTTLRNFRRGGAPGFWTGVERVRRRFRGGGKRRSQTLGG